MSHFTNYSTSRESSTTLQRLATLTGACRFPVKNFLICLDITICAGVTGGSLTHDPPAVTEYKTGIRLFLTSGP